TNQGLSVEAHAQNVLIGLGEDMLPNGEFLHRDFGGFHIDFDFRKKNKLKIPKNLPVIHTLKYDYHRRPHDTALATSLHIYFTGGFVFNLDQNVPEWAKAGLIAEYKNQGKERFFETLVYKELAKKLKAPKEVNLEDPRVLLSLLEEIKKNPVRTLDCRKIATKIISN
ncbi:MAG: hypothetical protein K2Q18_18625, partial [Bdellovibrionales bacterium]|nr:hypothetical protein [Bdellovibrionales bacterium]